MPLSAWAWVTGEAWSYTNWHAGEPNGGNGQEDYLQWWLNNQWNDRPNEIQSGYIVEFDVPTGAIPEPGTMSLLFAGGLPGLGLAFRRLRRR